MHVLNRMLTCSTTHITTLQYIPICDCDEIMCQQIQCLLVVKPTMLFIHCTQPPKPSTTLSVISTPSKIISSPIAVCVLYHSLNPTSFTSVNLAASRGFSSV